MLLCDGILLSMIYHEFVKYFDKNMNFFEFGFVKNKFPVVWTDENLFFTSLNS
jgi:hypothetical protein